MKTFNQSNNGVDFVLKSEYRDGLLVIHASAKNRTAGHLYALVKGNELYLNDLHVTERIKYPFFPLLGNFSLQVTLKLRNQGIGRAMMKTALDVARSLRVKKVVGEVVQRDLEKAPFLLDWYRSLGFEIMNGAADFLPLQNRKIVLTKEKLYALD